MIDGLINVKNDFVIDSNKDYQINDDCNINVIRVLPKISWSRINKHWFTIEIQDLSLIIDGRKSNVCWNTAELIAVVETGCWRIHKVMGIQWWMTGDIGCIKKV